MVALPERWFVLRRGVDVQHDANALVGRDLGLKLPLDTPPPGTTRLTALTRVGGVVHGQLSIVAKSNEDLLLHEHERPAELPDNPNIFFVALDGDFKPDVRADVDAAGRRGFDVTATRVLDRDPELPAFSAVRNVGFLSIRGRRGDNDADADAVAKYAVAELQANNLHEEANAVTVPFITFRHGRPNEPDAWDLGDLNWPVVGDEANPEWTTHDVIAHDEKLWWVNLSRGLVACDPFPAGNIEPRLEFLPLPVLPGFDFDDRHEPLEHIDRYRIVGVSAGGMRFVDVARRRNDPEGNARVVVWTLGLPQLINDAEWQDRRETTLENIWNSANYGQMPRDEVPVVALVHPKEPAVVYFFLDQYVFSVDVNQSAVVDVAVMPDGEVDGVPRPINQRDVLAWQRPHFKVRTVEFVHEMAQELQQQAQEVQQQAQEVQQQEDEDPAEG